MTKYEISNRILNLLDCDGEEIIDAIYDLAREVRNDCEIIDWDGEEDDD